MKIIAHHLPQYHSIPENDKWWGKGYTEWTAVKNARQLFRGHNQPRVPANNYYYNLLDDGVLNWQANLAKKYGIYGFCFYHYWFKGKLLLERPLEKMLESGEPDFPFCFSWANEPWTRTWYGQEKIILMPQDYGNKEDWKRHFDYLSKFFSDKRYIKVEGKPVFLIYNSTHIERCNEMIDYWRNIAPEFGFPGIHLIQTRSGLTFDTRTLNFDAEMYFEPGFTTNYCLNGFWRLLRKSKAFIKRNLNKLPLGNQRIENIINYDLVYKKILNRKPSGKKAYLGVFTDWDNTPRRVCGTNSTIYIGSSPEKFEKYLVEQIVRSKEIFQSDMMFVNAWNEWGEGAYLEPDTYYGHRYLESVKKALITTGDLTY